MRHVFAEKNDNQLTRSLLQGMPMQFAVDGSNISNPFNRFRHVSETDEQRLMTAVDGIRSCCYPLRTGNQSVLAYSCCFLIASQMVFALHRWRCPDVSDLSLMQCARYFCEIDRYALQAFRLCSSVETFKKHHCFLKAFLGLGSLYLIWIQQSAM